MSRFVKGNPSDNFLAVSDTTEQVLPGAGSDRVLIPSLDFVSSDGLEILAGVGPLVIQLGFDEASADVLSVGNAIQMTIGGKSIQVLGNESSADDISFELAGGSFLSFAEFIDRSLGGGDDTMPGDGDDTMPGDGNDTMPGDGDDTMPGDGDGQTIVLTTGIDILNIGPDDVVVGNSETFNPGDQISGASGTVDLFLEDSNESGTLTNLDTVNVNPNGTVTINAENWTQITQINIIEVDDGTDFEIREIQNSVLPSVLYDDVDESSTITAHYDGQDLNMQNRVVDAAVREFNGTLVIETDANSATETINLDVQDTADFESSMNELVGQGTETLNISGGVFGIDFAIEGPLDPGITTLNASALDSNASLNVSESTEAMRVDLGLGDDVLYVGDTLFDDEINGGPGLDRVVAEFVDPDTRMPTMTGVEILEATFEASVTFGGSNVEDLETVYLNASSGRADFNNMSSTDTLSTVNILGDLAQGVEVDYDGVAPVHITFNIKDDTSAIGNAGNDYGIQVINANSVTLNHKGDEDVTISNGIRVDDSFAGQFTTDVLISSSSGRDLTILETTQGPNSPTVIADGNQVQRLSVMASDNGNVYMPAPTGVASSVLMAEAGALQHYTLEAASGSNISVGVVGDENGGNAASDLETIDVSAGGNAQVIVAQIDAEGPPSGGAATIDQINVSAGLNATVSLQGDDGDVSWLEAASVNQMIVTAGNGALVSGQDMATVTQGTGISSVVPDFSAEGLINLELNDQSAGSILTVQGEGTVPGFVFEDNNIQTINATGLEGSGITIVNANPFTASALDATFLGSEQDDNVVATNEDDVLHGNGGNDRLIGLAGDDVITGGEGNDILFGDADDSIIIVTANTNSTVADGLELSGNDVIDGGSGDDYIAGNANATPDPAGNILDGAIGDVLTGGEGSDIFYFDIGVLDPFFDTGKSTASSLAGNLMQDVITDFSAAGDRIEFGTDTQPADDYLIAWFQDDTSVVTFGGDPSLPLGLVLRTGDYNADGTFNQDSDGADLQLLVNQEVEPFVLPGAGDVIAALLNVGGDVLFNQADFEIGLLGAADQGGSIDSTDFIFS